jgi:ADP-heptose:LPS heptosyltransferase
MKDVRKVLVIKLEDLAQLVASFAAMRQIRAAHPRAHITLLTTPPFAAIARASPYFDAVNTTGEADAMRMASAIKGEKFDRVYDLEGSKRTRAIRRWMWPFGSRWVGLDDADDDLHLLERHARMLSAAGVWPDAPVEAGSAPPPDLSWILKRVAPPRPVPGAIKPKPYVLMIPGGADDRRWPEASFGAAAAAFRRQGFDIVVIGGPEHSAHARAIQRHDPKARDLTGRTDIFQLALTGSRAALAIGNDSAQTHLVAAAGAATLVLFPQGADPSAEGPRGHVAFLQAENLGDISVDQVLRAAASIAPEPAAK